MVREFMVPRRWFNRGLIRNGSPGLFRFTPKTLENGGQILKYNFFTFWMIRWSSTFQFSPSENLLVALTPCDLICFLVLWTKFYSKYYPVLNWYSVIKLLIIKLSFSIMYYHITLCDPINFEIVSHKGTLYWRVKSYETPLKEESI